MKYEYFFTDSHIDQIRDGAVSILSEIGVKVGRADLLDQLTRKGFKADGRFVKIDKSAVLKKIAAQRDYSPAPKETSFTTYISSYSNTYENNDGSYSPITTESNAEMGRFAVNASKRWPVLVPTCPGHPDDVPPDLQFFRHAVNSFIWCEGFSPMEPVSSKIAPYHFELCDVMGKTLNDLPVYIASPLSIAGESLDIALAFRHKVKALSVGSMPCLGASTPMNLIAAYAQTVAETAGCAVLLEELTGIPTYYSTNIFPFDFYDMSMPFGTPEKLLLEWTNMEVAARLCGNEFKGPTSADMHTNAPHYGIQACLEKAAIASTAAMMGAKYYYCSGTLGMDELFSPVQLILDLEMLDYIKKLSDGMPKDGFDGDLIDEVRKGLSSGYIMSDRTIDNMLEYIWHSGLFTRKSFGSYRQQPVSAEVEKAKEMVTDIMAMPPAWKISDELESEAERIYSRAREDVLK